MSKKTLVLLSCLVLALAVGLSSSLAYLTDTDEQVNTFTMGGVQIKVEENFGDGTDTDYEEAIRPGAEVNKDAWIKNTGNNDAYVWMTVEVPAALKDVITLHWFDQNDPKYTTENIMNDKGEIVTVYTALNEYKVAPEQTSRWFLDKVTMSNEVDVVRVKDDVTGEEKTEYYLVSGGERTKIEYNLSNFQIVVKGYAIQAEGFDNVEAAYAAYNAQWEAEKSSDAESNGEDVEANDNTSYDGPVDGDNVENDGAIDTPEVAEGEVVDMDNESTTVTE